MKKNRIISTLLLAGIVCIAPSLLPKDVSKSVGIIQEVYAATITATQDGFTFSIDSIENTATVTNNTNTGNVIIPESVNGVPVTAIGDSVFWNSTGLTSVVIPDSVTSIGRQAFYGCTKLVNIDMPDSVKSLGDLAFDNCINLTSVRLSENLKFLGIQAFYNCNKIISINIPNTVTSIGSQAFNGCTALMSVSMKDSSASIGVSAFDGCTKLTTMDLTNFTGSISASAFASTPFLTANSYTENGLKYLIIENNAYMYGYITAPTGVLSIPSSLNSGLYLVKGITGLSGSTGLTSVVIPDGVTSIGGQAFYGCTNLVSVKISDSVKSIESFAFCNCTKVSSIDIPESVGEIGASAFYNCYSMSSIEIPDSVTDIGDSSFYNCYKLSSVKILGQVISMGDNSFYGCSSLTNIVLPDSITSIGRNAFQGCSGLSVIELPKNLTGISSCTFKGCTRLLNVTIPKTVTSIDGDAFNGCTSISSITVPSSVKIIGGNAFQGCTNLSSITMHNGLTTLGSGAFYGCTSLVSLSIPDSVEYVGTNVFNNCTNLMSIRIPTKLLIPYVVPTGYFKIYFLDEDEQTPLGAWACKAGTSLVGLQELPSKIGYTFSKWNKSSMTQPSVIGNVQGDTTFIASYREGSITVPDPTIVLSTESAPNRDSTVTAEIGNTQNGYSYYYTLDGTTPTATNGILLNGNSISIPKQDQDSEKNITVKVVGTKSGVYSNVATRSVTFLSGTVGEPDPTTVVDGITYSKHKDGTISVKNVSTTKTGEIIIPDKIEDKDVTSIDQSAFKGCVGITSINIPGTITSINAYAFQGCTGLTSMTLPDSVSNITSSAFNGCTNLKYIKMNSGIVGDFSVSGMNRVYFIDDDESNILGGWLVKTGASMIGKQENPVKANYTFSKWTKYNSASFSILGNIQDNTSFEAVYNSTPGTLGPKVEKPKLNITKVNANNRESDIDIKIS